MAIQTKTSKIPLTRGPERSHLLGSRTVRRPSGEPHTTPPAMDLLAKEEEYKRLNAELEAKTAELVRQAEQVMRDQNEVLSKPLTSLLDVDFEVEEDDFRKMNQLDPPLKLPRATVVTKRRVGSKPPDSKRRSAGIQRPTQMAKVSVAEDVAVLEHCVDFSLAETIQTIEGRLDKGETHDDVTEDVMPSVGEEMGSDAQIRFLKAKLRVMQEELNRLSYEFNQKDDENSSLKTKLKELEEDRGKLQKTCTIQQSQTEKLRAVAEESGRSCEGLKQQVAALLKESKGLKKAQRQAASAHSAVEVRLNRALEDAERFRTQLGKTQQQNKDTANQEHQKIETLQAENKKLEKQKAELIVGFKKQLKLIDVLKRQKMHFEAAKMLSFTEEEFMKALDWGKP